MIPPFPQSAQLNLSMRGRLHPMFQKLGEGISEFTFANLFLFRDSHHYQISEFNKDLILITGSDKEKFFMCPFGLPEQDLLTKLFDAYHSMKCVSEPQAETLTRLGYTVREDRDNFDYLYLRKDLADLAGRKFSKKRNRIKAFINNYEYEGRPLLDHYKKDALAVLERWREGRDASGDYSAAAEALEYMDELQLCGGIYYSKGTPIAYTLGEELMTGTSFAIHFEKAVDGYNGLWQFINKSFASILPEKYKYINREQDLGDDGLRQAKLSYKPVDFIKKYRAWPP